MNNDLEKAIKAAVKEGINGQIADLRNENKELFVALDEKLTAHMKRVEPVIKAYEDEKAVNAGMQKLGDRTIFVSKVIGAIGVIAAAVIFAAMSFVKYKP